MAHSIPYSLEVSLRRYGCESGTQRNGFLPYVRRSGEERRTLFWGLGNGVLMGREEIL